MHGEKIKSKNEIKLWEKLTTKFLLVLQSILQDYKERKLIIVLFSNTFSPAQINMKP